MEEIKKTDWNYLYDKAEKMFTEGATSLKHIINVIDYTNSAYGFNLYDNNEELRLAKSNEKNTIKIENICKPLSSSVNKMLKANIILEISIKYKNASEEEKLSIIKSVIESNDVSALIATAQNLNNVGVFSRKFAATYEFSKKIENFKNDFSYSGESCFPTDITNISEEQKNNIVRDCANEFQLLSDSSQHEVRKVNLAKLIQSSIAIYSATNAETFIGRTIISPDDVNFVFKGVNNIYSSNKQNSINDGLSTMMDEYQPQSQTKLTPPPSIPPIK